jgi:hypothetical protein
VKKGPWTVISEGFLFLIKSNSFLDIPPEMLYNKIKEKTA